MTPVSESVSHIQDYLPRYFKLAISWLIIGVLYYVFRVDIQGVVFVGVCFIGWLYWAAGIVLIMLVVGEVWLQTTIRPFPKNIATAIAAVMICGVSLSYLGPHYGLLVRFCLFKPHYERLVDRISRDFLSDRTHATYYPEDGSLLDEGPPIRVAIVLPGGLLDNFQAVVYDPSEVVGQLERSNRDPEWDDPRFPELRTLFGGDMYYCEPIQGPWFYCWFT